MTQLYMHIHTYTRTYPPSPLHHSHTSSSLVAFLCSCGVIRSYICFFWSLSPQMNRFGPQWPPCVGRSASASLLPKKLKWGKPGIHLSHPRKQLLSQVPKWWMQKTLAFSQCLGRPWPPLAAQQWNVPTTSNPIILFHPSFVSPGTDIPIHPC